MEAPEATCQGCRRGHGAECAGYRKPSGVDGDRGRIKRSPWVSAFSDVEF